ncbi:MAG: Re/Si-specific NAD(P)(+) transhydrogenase subunit alpha [Candidatus Brocadiaceae bacterium]|nr:Re/Si-specific NAD(P)(+) transhydrogenase subunit alpha [Candidatus Brocadiaceae bacterium]
MSSKNIIVGVPKEIYGGEMRVALVPKMISSLKRLGQDIVIEKGAGNRAFFSDEEYEQAGAGVAPNAAQLYAEADIIVKINPPQENMDEEKHEVEMMKQGCTYIGFLNPTKKPDVIRRMIEKTITGFDMEYMPRIARAQSMDILSSMSSIAGYRAVIIAAQYLGKFFPLMMTAAGTIPPVRVMILGAGVAGLQAIATARRLGASVEAFDVRPAVREQIESLGAKCIGLDAIETVETIGGYTKRVSDEFLESEREIIDSRIVHHDVVITTAKAFGENAPVLITDGMVRRMKKGAVIVDIAADQGGNCELTVAGKNIEKYGITICGVINLPATFPVDGSILYSKNMTNFITNLYKTKDGTFDFEDEITRSTCITYQGKIVNKAIKKTIQKEE